MSKQVVRRIDRRKVDVAKALVLRNKGVSIVDIAAMMNCSKQAILQATERYKAVLLTEEEAQGFDDVHGRVIKGAMMEMVRMAVDPARMKKMSSRDAIVNYGILFDKSRLLEGKSTANVLTGIVRFQKEALEETMQAISAPAGEVEPAEVIQGTETLQQERS